MIGKETSLKVADNTGAKKITCFMVLGGTRRRYARVGDVIIGSVKEVDPNSKHVKKKEVVRAVVIRTRKPVARDDGSSIRFYSNSCVLIDEKGNPRGTRMFGPIAREVREKGYIKICSLAPEVI